MTSTLPDLNDGTAWAVFLDIDGTLIELAATPDAVKVPPDLPPTLARLARRLDGALAMVSGRTLQEIDRLLPGGFDAAGTHGAEMRRAGATRQTPTPTIPAMREIRDRLGAFGAADIAGLLIEEKPQALALHYRAIPEREGDVLRLAQRVAAELGSGYRLLAGNRVWEVVPADASKGDAVNAFMALPPFRGRRPLFAGDDVTDLSAFAAVRRLGGVAVAIGNRVAASADVVLTSAPQARAWLAAQAAGGVPSDDFGAAGA